jgi:hypothetical protein
MAFIEIVKQPTYGTVYYNGESIIYTPTTDISINDYYIYKVIDNGTSTLYTRFVNKDNTPPITNNIELTIDVNTQIKLSVEILGSDNTKPFGDLVITNVDSGKYGSSYTDGKYIYYKSNNDDGIDVLNFGITDQQFVRNGTLTITVKNSNPINQDKYNYTLIVNNVLKDYNIIVSKSANYDEIFNFLKFNKDRLDDINTDKWSSYSNIVERLDLVLEDLSNKINVISSITNIVCSFSSNWVTNKSVYNILTSYSANWNNTNDDILFKKQYWFDNNTNFFDLSSNIFSNFNHYNTYTDTVVNISSRWDTSEINSIVSPVSDNLITLYTILTSNSSYWNDFYTNSKSFSGFYYTNKLNFQNMVSSVLYKYDTWNKRISSFNSTISDNSANWNNVYNSKQDYDSLYSLISTQSFKWITDVVLSKIISDGVSISGIFWNSDNDLINLKQDIWNNFKTNYYDITGNMILLNNMYNSYYYNNSSWNADYLNKFLNLTSTSANWESASKLLLSYYPLTWDYNNTIINQFSSFYYKNRYKFNNLYNNITANSASFFYDTFTNFLSTTSGYWDTTNNTLKDKLTVWNSFYNTSTSFSSIYYPNRYKFNNLYNNITANSASFFYDTFTNFLSTISTYWDNTHSLISDKLSVWNSFYSSTTSFSSIYYPNSINYRNLYNNITANSATFFSYDIINFLSSASATWDNTHSLVADRLTAWNSFYVTSTSFSSTYYPVRKVFNNFYNSITANSASFFYTDFNNFLSSNSAFWNTDHSLISDRLSVWNSFYNTSTSFSSIYYPILKYFKSLYNTVYTKSAGFYYTNITNLVSTNSGFWDTDHYLLLDRTSAWNTFYVTTTTFSSSYFKNSRIYKNLSNYILPNYSTWLSKISNVTNTTSSYSGNWNNFANLTSTYDLIYPAITGYINDVNLIKDFNKTIVLCSYGYNSVTTNLCSNSSVWNKLYDDSVFYINLNISLGAIYDVLNGPVIGTFQGAYVKTLFNYLSTRSDSVLYTLSGYNWSTALSVGSGSFSNLILSSYYSPLIDWNNLYNTNNINFSSFYVYYSNVFRGNYLNLKALSSKYNNIKSTSIFLLSSLSSNWNDVYNNKANYESVYTYISSNSGKNIYDTRWIDRIYSVQSNLSSLSSNWVDVYGNKSNYESLYSYLTANSAYLLYDQYFITNINNVQNIISSNSANWMSIYYNQPNYETGYTLVQNNSGFYQKLISQANNINSLLNFTSTYSASLNLIYIYHQLYNNIQTYSGNWNINYLIIDRLTASDYILRNYPDKWNNVYNQTPYYDSEYYTLISQNISESFIKIEDTNFQYSIYAFRNVMCSYSANWQLTNDPTVFNNTSYWISNYNILSSISSRFVINRFNYNNIYNIVRQKSAKWFLYPDYVNFNINSGNWSSVYNSKANYDYLTSKTRLLSTNYSYIGPIIKTIYTNNSSWSAYSGFILLSTQDLNANVVLQRTLSTNIVKLNTRYVTLFNKITSDISNYLLDTATLSYIINLSSTNWGIIYSQIYTTGSVTYWNKINTYVYNLTSSNVDKIKNYNNVSYLVNSLSDSWGDKTNLNVLTSNSGLWDTTYKTVSSSISGLWYFNDKKQYKDYIKVLSSLSAGINTGNNLVYNLSTNWLSGFEIIRPLIGDSISGNSSTDFYGNKLNVQNNMIIGGNLTGYKYFISLNTNVVTMSSLSIINTGNTVALSVNSITPFNGVTHFKNASATVFYINAINRTIGVNTSSFPPVNLGINLTVKGDLSATGLITNYLSDIITKYANNSANYFNIFTFLSSNSSNLMNFVSSYPKYDILYSFFNNNSSNYLLISDKIYFPNNFNYMKNQYNLNYIVSSYIVLSSYYFDKDTFYRSNSTTYDTIYSYVCSTSANVITAYSIQYYLNRGQTYGFVNIYDNIIINSYSLVADAQTNTTIDIKKSNIDTFPNTTSIVGGNLLTLNNLSSIKYNLSDSDNWTRNIDKDTYLTFYLTTNSKASSILVNLDVVKR